VLGALDAFCSWALTETKRRHTWLCASARFEFIPLLNVAMQFHDIAARLAKPKSFPVLEFTESEDQLVFIRLDDAVRITATWTGESVHVGVHTVRTALDEFRRLLSDYA